MTEALRRFIETPRVEWDAAFNKVDKAAISTVEHEADALCQLAAEISSYLSSRESAGCSDGGHEEALKDAKKDLRKVRKALGYFRP